VHWLVSRWYTPDVGFQGGLEVGAAFSQPVHHRMLRRHHSCAAGPQDTAELGECGRTVAGIVNGQCADDEVKGVIGVGQRLSERRLVDPHPARRLLPCQAHHDRARIKGGDLGPSFQQFTQVKARAAGCVQDLPAGERPKRGQHRWPVIVRVGRTVRRMLLEAHGPSCRRHPTGPHPRTHNGTRRQRWLAEPALPPGGRQASLAMPPPARYAATERKPDEPRHGGTQAAAWRLSRSAALPAVHARGCIAKQASGNTDRMVDDTARDRAIYHALKAADEVAAALQAHLIEEHGADPDRTAAQSPATNSLKLLRQARERLGEGLRAVEAGDIAESDQISLRNH